MLKFKTTAILLCAVTLLLSITVSALTLSHKDTTAKPDTNTKITSENITEAIAEAETVVETEDATVSESISIPSIEDLTYSSSKIVTDDYTIDIYNDSNKNEYWFSDSEEFVGYIYNDDPTVEEFIERKRMPDEKRPLNDKDDAVAFAKDFAKKVFGEKVDKYKLDDVVDFDDSYIITFKLTAGEDGFIIVRKCGVRVSKFGFIEACTTTVMDPDYEIYIAKIDSLTKADLTSNATAQLTEILGNVSDLTVNRAFLDKDGKSVAMQVFFNTTAKVTREIHDKYGISIIEGSRYECSFVYYPLS